MASTAVTEAVPVKPCEVCGDANPNYRWTDYSGEGGCRVCETPYQLKWGTLKDGETYPRINLRPSWIPITRRYWHETGQPIGGGIYMGLNEHRYPHVGANRHAFNAWLDAHADELPVDTDA